MSRVLLFFFFFNDTATTEIYTLSLHDALPILWHVMQLYLVQGVREFVLCTGYKRELIEDFAGGFEGADVECVDTGLDTFMATYADGVADLDLAALLSHHHAHGDAATVTVVRPELPFGVALLDG